MNPSGSQLNDLKLLIEENKIKAIIDKSFSFPESIKALLYLKKGRAKGKVVIELKK
jgi:alcohol dehydrogenase